MLDDFPYWVAEYQGYFEVEGIETTMDPGSSDVNVPLKWLMDDQSDVAYPWPGTLAAAFGQGAPIVSVWQMCAFDPFAFAFAKDAGMTGLKDLAGKRIAIAHENWQAICIPEIAQNGDLDPLSVEFVTAGETWGDAVEAGEADAALVWEGLRPQWSARGLDYDYLLGSDFSRFPGNSFVIRRSDYDDAELRDLYVRYLRGWAKGLEFARTETRAATQIVWERFPSLQQTYGDPTVAAEAVGQLTRVFLGTSDDYWGLHDFAAWDFFLTVFEEFAESVSGALLGDDPFSSSPRLAMSGSTDEIIGRVEEISSAEEVLTNALVDAANEFERERVQADAASFELSPEFETIPSLDI